MLSHVLIISTTTIISQQHMEESGIELAPAPALFHTILPGAGRDIH
jgi:hypothetical protein